MPKPWTTPPGARAAGPLYLTEVQEFVFDNLENRRTGDANGEMPVEAAVVATDYKISADPGDDLIDRFSIWHEPLQANAASVPCDADYDVDPVAAEFQEMCSVTLDRTAPSHWLLHFEGFVQTTYSTHIFDAKIGMAGAAFPLCSPCEGYAYGISSDYYLQVHVICPYTSSVADEVVFGYIGHYSVAVGGESAIFKGRLVAEWKGPA